MFNVSGLDARHHDFNQLNGELRKSTVLKHVCNLTLNTQNFPCLNIDATLGH